MSTSDKLNYLVETKNQIKTAIQNKGVSVTDDDTFRSYANKINQISGTLSDEWQPEPDWWDIESILENDTEDYVAKVILLLTDELDNKGIKQEIRGFSRYKLSDGQVITPDINTDTIDITDIFDTTKDKECSKGYKTRYIIGYYDNINTTMMIFPVNTLAIIIDGVKTGALSCFSNKSYLEYVKFLSLNLTISSFGSFFMKDVKLQKVEGLQNINNTTGNNTINFSSMFSYCTSLKKAPLLEIPKNSILSSMFNCCYSLTDISNLIIDTGVVSLGNMVSSTQIENFPFDFSSETITGVSQMFYDCTKLKKIGKINLQNMTDTVGTLLFANCVSLEDIEEITNISININFSSSRFLTHSTLLKILNALVDLTGQTSQTLTLGTTNLEKLTDEEKAIATDKNWILK